MPHVACRMMLLGLDVADKLKVLDLFSGIGGFSLGLERAISDGPYSGFETVAFCEIEPFPRKVLAKHWPEIFIHDDVKTLTKETLCKGYAKNALLNRLCKEMGGNIASVKRVIIHTKKPCGKETLQSIMNGPQNVAEALSIITAENVLVAENPNTRFWQLTTSLITAAKNGEPIKAQCGNSLSSADILTIIKFFVTTATWQNPSTVPARINEILGINDDVRTLTAKRLAADGIAVDVITGGFPCQDISVAGKQAGIGEGTRSGLWSECLRLVSELRPQYAIFENVANLLSGPAEKPGAWFSRILADLASVGYNAEWHNIPASYVGAWHRRGRVWLLAYSDKINIVGRGKQPLVCQSQIQKQSTRVFEGWPGRPKARQAGLLREADGLPDRSHRIAALGNSVVPAIPELIGNAILESLKHDN